MKKIFQTIFPALILLFLSLSLPASPPQALEHKTVEIISHLREGVIHEHLDQFTEQMRDFLKDYEGAGVWESIESYTGTFSEIIRFHHDTSGPYHIVTVVMAFSQGESALNFVYDQEEKIAGLTLAPVPPETFELPPYSDPAAFTETDLMLDCGDIQLPAKLSLPVGGHPVPVVILVHGSGPHDMDETIGPNKPFRDLAHGLATQGIAVLRYEKRTKYHGHSIDFDAINPWDETGKDAVKAVELAASLEGVDPERIYLLGHSLGGLMAPEIARKAPQLKGIILMGAPTGKLYDLLLEQLRYLAPIQDPEGEAMGEMILQVEEQVERIHRGELTPDSPRDQSIQGLPPVYWLYFKDYDQLKTALALPQRILVLQGERDYQVPMREFFSWRSGLRGYPGSTFKWYPGLNHLFMHGTGTPDPTEYFNPGHVEETVIRDIRSWILHK
jgi:uncharacterized protein